MDLAQAAVVVLKFQAAVAEYDEEGAMAFLNREAIMVLRIGDDPEKKYVV